MELNWSWKGFASFCIVLHRFASFCIVLHRFAWLPFQKLSSGTPMPMEWDARIPSRGEAPGLSASGWPRCACRATGLTELASVLGAGRLVWHGLTVGEWWRMEWMEWRWNEWSESVSISETEPDPSKHPSSPITCQVVPSPARAPLSWIDPHLRWGWKNSKASTLWYWFNPQAMTSSALCFMIMTSNCWNQPLSPWDFSQLTGFLTASPPDFDGQTHPTTSASWFGSHRRAVGRPTDPRPRATAWTPQVNGMKKESNF